MSKKDYEWKLSIKGGPGSGNWAHAGRPGLVGGSAPGGGLGYMRLAGDSTVEQRRAAARANKFRHIFAFTDPDTGISIKEDNWYDVYGDGTKWRFEGLIFNKAGGVIGRTERTVKVEGKEVHHDYFRLDSDYQGTGFGSAYYRHLERGYIRNGIEEITMLADLTVGGYAWARMGFDFEIEGERGNMAGYIARLWNSKYGGDERELKSQFSKLRAWEMAALTGPDGARIGKDVMLGRPWDAIKQMSPGSPHRKAGDVYYREKDKRKKK